MTDTGAPDTGALDTVVLDVDGTLVDSNYHHVMAWHRAFRAQDLAVPLWRLHRATGIGGDQYVREVAGDDVEERLGDDIRKAHSEEYAATIGDVAAFDGARELLVALRERGFRVVLASSANGDEVGHYLDLLDAREVAHAWTTSDDVERTKPAPDLVRAAVEKVGGSSAVMVGDATWDCRSAAEAGVPSVGVRTGGFSEPELREAGAIEVHDDVAALHGRLDDTFLARPR